MPYHFLTCQTYISQTCPQRTVRARIALAHSPLSPCGWRPSMRAVIGRRDEAGEWPPGIDFALSLTGGSRGEGWEGPSRHYKETELGHKLPAELSLIGQTFNLVYVCCEGVGSPHRLELEGPESLSCFGTARVSFFEFYHVGEAFVSGVIHSLKKGTVEETGCYDKRF